MHYIALASIKVMNTSLRVRFELYLYLFVAPHPITVDSKVPGGEGGRVVRKPWLLRYNESTTYGMRKSTQKSYSEEAKAATISPERKTFSSMRLCKV